MNFTKEFPKRDFYYYIIDKEYSDPAIVIHYKGFNFVIKGSEGSDEFIPSEICLESYIGGQLTKVFPLTFKIDPATLEEVAKIIQEKTAIFIKIDKILRRRNENLL